MWMWGNKTIYLRINIFNGINVGIILNKMVGVSWETNSVAV